jgi:PIN domain nuclease of toxin-antitoxin system
MLPRLLLDTHIVLRWLIDANRLARVQAKAVALSAITLLEIAVLASEGKLRLKASLNEFFDNLQGNPVFRVLPMTCEIASEVASLGVLTDPADTTIVATARIH